MVGQVREGATIIQFLQGVLGISEAHRQKQPEPSFRRKPESRLLRFLFKKLDPGFRRGDEMLYQ
jgi:hypothetical protein